MTETFCSDTHYSIGKRYAVGNESAVVRFRQTAGTGFPIPDNIRCPIPNDRVWNSIFQRQQWCFSH